MAEEESDGLTVVAYLTCAAPGLVVAAVMYTLFFCMRPLYPGTFAPRTKRVLPGLERLSPMLPQGLCTWVQHFQKLTIEETAQNVSTDAAARLIFQLSLVKIFAVLSILAGGSMLPVYITADGEESEFSMFTMANVIEEKSGRYWAVAAMAWPVSFIVYYFIFMALKDVLRLKEAEDKRVKPWQHFTVLVHEVPEASRSHEMLEMNLRKTLGDEVAYLQPVKAMGKQYEKDWTQYIKSWRAWKSAEAAHVAKPDKVPMTKDGFMGILGKKVEAIPFHKGKADEMRNKIEAGRANYESMKSTRFAFVSFRTLADASKSICIFKKGRWACSPVPHPRELCWATLVAGKSDAAQMASMASVVALTVLIILMFVPFMAFAMALVNLDDLAKEYDWLDWVNDIPEGVLGFIQGLLPVLVVIILNALVLPVFQWMAASAGTLEIKRQHQWVMWMYFWFLFMDSFLINLGVSSLLNQAEAIADRPEGLADLLGRAVPRSSGFFLCFVTLNTFAAAPGKLALLGPLIKGIVLGKWAKTDFEKEEALAPAACMFGPDYAKSCFFFVICVSYVVIAPLMSLLGCAYFVLQFISDKYLLNYVWQTEFHSGGFHVVSAFRAVTFGVFFGQFVLVSVLALEESPAAILAAPLLLSIVLVFLLPRAGPGAAILQQELTPALIESLTRAHDGHDMWQMVEHGHQEKHWTQPSLAGQLDDPLKQWFAVAGVDSPSTASAKAEGASK